MLTRRPVFLLLALVLLFAAGIAHLFVLRFQKGDIYPPYSSLRSDPLGTKVFYEALREINGLEVTRNYRSLRTTQEPPHELLFYLGMPRRYFAWESDLEVLDAQIRAGARVVLAFQPEKSPFDPKKEAAEEKKAREKARASEEKEAGKKLEPDKAIPRWNVKIVALQEIAPATAAFPHLEPTISTHSFTSFAPEHPAWKTLYEVNGKPVIIERNYGLGTLVLCADSWIFSNEALRTERRPNLLLEFLAGHKSIVFDETHHGISKQTGIANLARRYRLHGAFAMCLLLGILFVWRNSFPLVPHEQTDRSEAEVISGQDANTGLVNLLRRSIPPRDLVATCLAQWRHSPSRPISENDLARANTLASDPNLPPLERFRSLCKLLNIHAKRN